jgi:hypothetical protein
MNRPASYNDLKLTQTIIIGYSAILTRPKRYW